MQEMCECGLDSGDPVVLNEPDAHGRAAAIIEAESVVERVDA